MTRIVEHKHFFGWCDAQQSIIQDQRCSLEFGFEIVTRYTPKDQLLGLNLIFLLNVLMMANKLQVAGFSINYS